MIIYGSNQEIIIPYIDMEVAAAAVLVEKALYRARDCLYLFNTVFLHICHGLMCISGCVDGA